MVTSIKPEILLLSERIGAVDAPFMAKAYARLQVLVKQPRILMVRFELETSYTAPQSRKSPKGQKTSDNLPGLNPKRVFYSFRKFTYSPHRLPQKGSQPAEIGCYPTPEQPRGKSNLWNLQ